MLQAQLQGAFAQFSGELQETGVFARENELVSLFSFGSLLECVAPGMPLSDRRQIGIEVAVEQMPQKGQSKPQVRKDLVIWRDPSKTLWTQDGHPSNSPLAILEWKGGAGRARIARARVEVKHDYDYLRWFVGKHPTSEGYSVVAERIAFAWRVSVARFSADGEETEWFRSAPTPAEHYATNESPNL